MTCTSRVSLTTWLLGKVQFARRCELVLHVLKRNFLSETVTLSRDCARRLPYFTASLTRKNVTLSCAALSLHSARCKMHVRIQAVVETPGVSFL